MELLEKFGVDAKLLIAQAINFLVILYLLKRFLYKPVLDLLQKRQEAIQEGIENAQAARASLEKAKEEEKRIIRDARQLGEKLLENAKNQKLEILKQAEAETAKKTEKMLIEAKEQIDLEAKEAERRLSESVSELAIEFLRNSSRELFSQKEQEELIKHALKTVKQRAD